MKRRMTTPWHSLYSPSSDQEGLAAALRAALTVQGFTLYDPFQMLAPGQAYSRSVRVFVAPARDGWTRVLGALETPLIESLSQTTLCLSAALDGDRAQIAVYAQGVPADPVAALAPHLRADYTPDALRRALAGETISGAHAIRAGDTFPMDVLPESMREQARGLNPKAINAMFGKLMKKVNRQLGTDARAGMALIGGGADWDSRGGRMLQAAMACLTVPDDWRVPDFVSVRDAYQLHRRRQQRPNALLYPGDADAMQNVPDALQYIPVYAGTKA